MAVGRVLRRVLLRDGVHGAGLLVSTIIAHRGYWTTPAEQNSPQAIRAALERGWGVEFDVWRRGVGHERRGMQEFFTEDGDNTFCGEFEAALRVGDGPLLWNVKEREVFGQWTDCRRTISDPAIWRRSWIFDHELVGDESIPALWADANLLARASDREPLADALAKPWARGIWLDTFTTPWVTPDVLAQCRDAGKTPFIVSPELHRQPVRLADWQAWDGAAICTDMPQLLEAFRTDDGALMPKEPWW